YKPFKRHDRIVVSNMEGTVQQIDLRFTTLRLDDREILIPNANLLTNAITVLHSKPLKTPSHRDSVSKPHDTSAKRSEGLKAPRETATAPRYSPPKSLSPVPG